MSVPKALAQWSVHEVGEWIEGICRFNNLANYKSNFVNHHVDGHSLSTLKEKDLEEVLGIPGRDATTLVEHVHHLAAFIESVQRPAFVSDLQPPDILSVTNDPLNETRNGQYQFGVFNTVGREWLHDPQVAQERGTSVLDVAHQLINFNFPFVELLTVTPQLHLSCLVCGKIFAIESEEQIKCHIIEHTQRPAVLTFSPPAIISDTVNLQTSPSTLSPLLSESKSAGTLACTMHKLSSHTSKTDKELNILSTERKWRCLHEGCGKSFKRLSHLRRHEIVHRALQERTRYLCSEPGCTKHYSTKYDLAAHIRQVLWRSTRRRLERPHALSRQQSLDVAV